MRLPGEGAFLGSEAATHAETREHDQQVRVWPTRRRQDSTVAHLLLRSQDRQVLWRQALGVGCGLDHGRGADARRARPAGRRGCW